MVSCKMWSFYNLQVLVVVLNLHGIWSLSPLWDSVKTNVHQEYDVQEGNNQVWVVRMNMGEYKGNDLVVGEDIRPDSRIILTCTAWYPAEWVYSGDGKPEFTTNSTTENLSSEGKILPLEDMNGAKRYVATLTVGKNRLKTTDTGRYNCMTASPETGMKYKTLSAFYHLYVPGEKLFIREGMEIINYDLRKSPARIPCGVTNPKAAVSLQKLENGNLNFVPNGGMFYHPISGYYPKHDIPGTYVCTGSYNNTFQLIHFTLVPASTLGSSYHDAMKFKQRKPIKETNKPEDMEWLMHSVPFKTSTGTTSTRPKPRPRPAVTHSSFNKLTKSTTPYIPFHIRYTSTYGPFFTFQDNFEPSTTLTPNKHSSTSKYKPFDPFEYPSDIIMEQSTKRPYSNSFEQKIYNSQPQAQPTSGVVSYEPVFNYFKDSSKLPSIDSYDSPAPIKNKIKHKQRTTPFPSRLTRTTPRKFRPNLISTTETSVLIPQQVICSQVSCGIDAECVVINAFYSTSNETIREAACKCISNYTGNPYLECRPPMLNLDPNLLVFNSSFRTQLKQDSIRNRPDGDSSSEKHGTTLSSLDIIDM